MAKSVIVAGVRRTPWEARAEQSGTTSAGEAWIADVLAKHEGKRSVAFEVQWSRQTKEETVARQHRYKAAGIRGLWFFRQHDFPVNVDVPAFRLKFYEVARSFQVMLPSPVYNAEWLSVAERDEPRYWQQTIELSRFVEGALTGRLQFAPALNKILPREVFVARTRCWRCHKTTRVITGLNFAAGKVLPNCPDVECSIHAFDKVAEGGAKIIRQLLPGYLLARHGIGMIKPRDSKTVMSRYISNGCVHCDALQGRFYDYNLGPGELALSVEAYFDEAWATQLPAAPRYLNCWWFDDSF